MAPWDEATGITIARFEGEQLSLLLDDLANHLWQDSRPTYDLLGGNAANGRLEVGQSKTKNRLRAYLHQKGVGKRSRRLLDAEANRLGDSLDRLHDLTNLGHTQVDRNEIRSAAVATYYLVGEMCVRTDMKPVTSYSNDRGHEGTADREAS